MLTLTAPSGSSHDQAVRRRWRLALFGLLAFLLAFGALLGQNPESAAADPDLTVERIAGADRYEVAVNISKAANPGTSYVAVLVTGENYPDALSSVPLATRSGSPLLLTAKDALPAGVKAELERLQVKEVRIVGGLNSVSAAVENEVSALPSHPVVNRTEGADRFEVSRNVMNRFSWSSSPSSTYLATGSNFPDALSSGPAAAQIGAPVLLVNGSAATLDAATKSTLQDNLVTAAAIAGGPNSVSPGIEADLESFIPTVERLGGADRFQASLTINDDAFSSASEVFLATGLKFPDALSGGAFAGRLSAPLFVVPSDCVPQGVLDSIARLGATKVTLLGGTASLSPAVEALTPCSP